MGLKETKNIIAAESRNERNFEDSLLAALRSAKSIMHRGRTEHDICINMIVSTCGIDYSQSTK